MLKFMCTIYIYCSTCSCISCIVWLGYLSLSIVTSGISNLPHLQILSTCHMTSPSSLPWPVVRLFTKSYAENTGHRGWPLKLAKPSTDGWFMGWIMVESAHNSTLVATGCSRPLSHLLPGWNVPVHMQSSLHVCQGLAKSPERWPHGCHLWSPFLHAS